MIKRKALAGFLLVFLTFTMAQAQDMYLAKVWKNGQFGFIDVDGREVIPEIYDDVKTFSEGLVPVNIGAAPTYPKKGGLWGYCDFYGRMIIKMQYQDVKSFSEGLAAVKQRGKWGYIDRLGEVVIPMVYEEAGDFSLGLAPVKINGKWGYIETSGAIKVGMVFDRIFPFDPVGYARVFIGQVTQKDEKEKWEGHFGIIDKNGDYLLEPQYDHIGDFVEGLAQVTYHDSVGYINESIRFVIPPTYASGGDFKEGLARVSIEHAVLKGFDTPEQQVLYDSLLNLWSEMTIAAGKDKQKLMQVFNSPIGRKISAMQTGHWKYRSFHGYIDKNGREVIPLKYDWAEDFENGLACVRVGPNTRTAFLDSDIMKPDSITGPPETGVSRGEPSQKPRIPNGYGYINQTGKEVIPPIYLKIKRYKDNIFTVADEYGVKAVDLKNQVVVPDRYRHLRYCGDNLFIFSDVDRQGLIWKDNIDTEVILDPAFEEVIYLNRQRLKVKREDGLSGIINTEGGWVVEPSYDHIVNFEKVN